MEPANQKAFLEAVSNRNPDESLAGFSEIEKKAIQSDYLMQELLSEFYSQQQPAAAKDDTTAKGFKGYEWLSFAAGFVILFSGLFHLPSPVNEVQSPASVPSTMEMDVFALPMIEESVSTSTIEAWRLTPADIGLFQKAYNELKIEDPEQAEKLKDEFLSLNGFPPPEFIDSQ